MKPDVSRFFVLVYQAMDAFGNTRLGQGGIPELTSVTIGEEGFISSGLTRDTTGSLCSGAGFTDQIHGSVSGSSQLEYSGVRACKISV